MNKKLSEMTLEELGELFPIKHNPLIKNGTLKKKTDSFARLHPGKSRIRRKVHRTCQERVWRWVFTKN